MKFKKNQIPWNKKPIIIKECLFCDNKFIVKSKHQIYCCHNCYSKNKIGQKSNRKYIVSKETKEKLKQSMKEQYRTGKRISPWKGRHAIPWNKGKVFPQFQGKNNATWKGDEACYSAIHKWLQSYFKKHNCCDFCGESDKKITWANISGQYKRNREDYLCLCYKCHNKMDKERKIKNKFANFIKDNKKYDRNNRLNNSRIAKTSSK